MMTKLSAWVQRILRYAPLVTTLWQRIMALIAAVRTRPTTLELDAPIKREIEGATTKLVELQTRAAARKASIKAKKS